MANKNKIKGNTLEQQICKDLREKYPFVKTARYGNRMADDSKIDIIGVPFLIQAKSGYNKPRLKYEELVLECKELIQKHFPSNHPVHKLPYILINKLNRVKGGKQSQPEMFQVTLDYSFFLELINQYKTDNPEC
jgi:hypothetical protein